MSTLDDITAAWPLEWRTPTKPTTFATSTLLEWRATWAGEDVRLWKWDSATLWTGEIGGAAIKVHASSAGGAAASLRSAVEHIHTLVEQELA